ncbi:MAG: hypothetical protein ACTHMB_04355, partial [Candidatus Binatia bacterium]
MSDYGAEQNMCQYRKTFMTQYVHRLREVLGAVVILKFHVRPDPFSRNVSKTKQAAKHFYRELKAKPAELYRIA